MKSLSVFVLTASYSYHVLFLYDSIINKAGTEHTVQAIVAVISQCNCCRFRAQFATDPRSRSDTQVYRQNQVIDDLPTI